jgi:D-alanine transaminase
MSGIIACYNQNLIPLDELKVSITDRAFFFGDAVYEVLRVYRGKPFLLENHHSRLSNSLRAMDINGVTDLREDIVTNIALNQVDEGMVYLQISRGEAPRNHSFHNLSLKPNILIYTKPFIEHPSATEGALGIAAITHEDLRWGRCDIKSTNLLANCLIQTYAQQRGSAEAILIRQGLVTEGTSSNIFMVKNGQVCTPPLSPNILPGTRREFVIRQFLQQGQQVFERPISKDELYTADEIFITSSIKEAVAVIKLDYQPVGNGQVSSQAKLARTLIEDAASRLSRD